ncbi:MAG: sulfate adenylyltransferase subunit CysN [Phycisphaerales bacterium]|nr:MAG: sulfate adenylyltransferase subunit CysN [Phycisphaerales bacterium]
MDLLRLLTCGSVDDGKSTLIGRLLYDSKSIFEDQLAAAETASKSRGDERVNLALLTDGLRAEREQGITIDVAYRYFATPRRKFIIADCPGHVQYTRNMVTGASTANLAVVLIDARQGVVEQTRRHSFIASLLRIPHVVVCINKMDLVNWDEGVFEKIRADYEDFAAKLEIADVTFIPMSALLGDNVVTRSEHMAWYQGPSLMHHLEHVHIASDRDLINARFPVQWVVRPQSDEHHDYRGYAGQVASGVFRPGDRVVALPGGFESAIATVEVGGEPVEQAFAPMSVTITLEDDIDVSRGDCICKPDNRPHVGQDVEAMLVWMADEPMHPRKKYAIKHTSRLARCMVTALKYRLNIETLHKEPEAEGLTLNEIGRVSLRTTAPLMFDPYRQTRQTGCFILIDEATNRTVGAGMILGPAS